MELLNEIYIPEYESQIYKSPVDNKYYTKMEYAIKNISFPINIISEQNIKRCAIMIIINTGYIVETKDIKYDNYIKLIFELLFEQKNSFKELFQKYNLKYKNKIYPEKTIIYFECDYKGFNPVFSNFVKNIIFFDRLIVQNNIKEILNSINLANEIDITYLYYKKYFQKNLEINNITDKEKKEMDLLEFFQYFFIKNTDKYITILSPYSNEKCKDIILKIFDKYKKDIRNNIFKTYEKYTPLNIKFIPFDEPTLLVVRKIDIEKNNIMKLKFYFPNLSPESENILEYFVYMINGERIGSYFYNNFKSNYIIDLKAYSNYSHNMPPQMVIIMKLFSNFNNYSLKIIIGKFINFLRKLKQDVNNIKITYENYQKMLLHNFNNNYIDSNYYYFLYEFTNNFISIQKDCSNQNDSNKYLKLLLKRYLLPEYNITLINNVLNEIIALRNLKITLELHPKLFTYFSNGLKRDNFVILNNKFECNEFNTYNYAIMNIKQLIAYASSTQGWDSSSFKHKQDKKKYISKEINTNIKENNKSINNDNIKVHLGLNTIANKLWYYIPDCNDINNINSSMIFSKFHIIHPNIRNYSNNKAIYRTNVKYYNYLNKKIEQEFEEIFEMGNEINLTRDENGFNLEIKSYKDIYIKILEKIFSFFFEFENDFVEYNDVNYLTEYFKTDFDKAINCLQTALKKEINEKFFEDKNNKMDIFKLKLFGVYLEENIYINAFISGNIDNDFIKKIKNVILAYNTREYESSSIFENISEFKKKIFDTKKLNEGTIYIFKLSNIFREMHINYFISFYQILDLENNKKVFLFLIYLLLKKHLNSENCKIYKIYIDQIFYILIIRKSLDYPEYMAKHVSLNIKKLIDIICFDKDNDDNNLKQILLNLKQIFIDEISNFKFKYDFIWSEIYNDTYNFEIELKDEKEFEDYIENKIDLNEFKNFFKNNFFEKQRKIEFLFYQDSIKYFNNTINKNKDSYPWNIDFIANNNILTINEIYNNINKIN